MRGRVAFYTGWAFLCLASSGFGGQGFWNTSGPMIPDSIGTVLAIRAAPAQPSLLYAATSDGGVFRSADRGETWESSSRGLQPSGLLTVVPDPVRDGILFAGYQGFHPLGSTRNTYGLFKTMDGGGTWRRVPFNYGVQAMAIDPTDPEVLYVAAELTRSQGPTFPRGVWISRDGGENWTAPTFSIGWVSSIAVDPRQSSVVWAVGAGINRSDDRGASWNLVDLAPATGANIVAFDPFRLRGVYVGTGQGLYYVEAIGGTPTLVSGSVGLAIRAIAFDPSDARTLTLGTSNGIYQTRDGGSSFSRLEGAPGGAILTLEMDGQSSTLYAGSGTGIVRSLDGGASWAGASEGLWYTRVTDLIPIPQTESGLRALAEGDLFERTDAGGEWSAVSNFTYWGLPLAGELTAAPSEAERLYVLIGIPFLCGDLLASRDGGRTWTSGAVPTCGQSVAVSPRDADEIVVGGSAGFPSEKSLDGGSTWYPILAAAGFVSEIRFAPSDPSTLYALSRSYQNTVDVLRTTNGGAFWANVGRLAGAGPSAIAVDPSDSRLLYAAVPPASFYRLDDLTWSHLGDASGLSLVRAIVVDPVHSDRLWAAGEGGVFVSDDAGKSWRDVNAGLTDPSVNALVVDPSGRTVHAATQSRGVFDMELSPDRSAPVLRSRSRPNLRTIERP